jgi:hypothetical protein
MPEQQSPRVMIFAVLYLALVMAAKIDMHASYKAGTASIRAVRRFVIEVEDHHDIGRLMAGR